MSNERIVVLALAALIAGALYEWVIRRTVEI